MAIGQLMEFTRPDGQATRGYLAQGRAGGPGVIVIQEWWGLNEQICSVADRFAEAGYTALAPDLYRGRIANTGDEASHLMNTLDFADATHQDLRGAAQVLSAQCASVGVMGFCMGGALTIAAAVHVPGLAAASCFYGVPPAEFADPAQIRMPFQGHFADRDDWITPAVVDQLELALKASPSAVEIYRYAADHAFFNRTRPEVYDAAAADLAWQRTLSFLGQHLR
jgi:carboxymethylenebutenolidase